MSTVAAARAPASAGATVSTILARRGVLTATCDRRASRRRRSGPAARDERPPRRSDCVRPPGGRECRGMVQRGALLAGSTPWQSTRFLPARAGGRHGRDLASGSDPAASPQHRCVGRLALLLLVFYVIFAFPEGRVASRFGWALLGVISLQILESYVPSAPLLAGRLWPVGAFRLQRCVSRERLHDRRSADARRRFFQRRTSRRTSCSRSSPQASST